MPTAFAVVPVLSFLNKAVLTLQARFPSNLTVLQLAQAQATRG